MPATKEEYLSLCGGRCPNCTSMAVDERKVPDDVDYVVEDDLVPMKCKDCGSTWLEEYETKLVGYRNLETKKETEEK